MSEPIRLWKEHDAMAAIVNGVKSPQFTLDRRALEDFAYPDEEYAALPAAEFAALSARVAKLEAEQSEARKRAARLEAALRFYADASNYGQSHGADCGQVYTGDGNVEEYHGGDCGMPEVMRDDGAKARAVLEDKP